ncbi:neuropeptide FF receptor 1 [Amia ocellicauda]|uniref:neuropeptide FF receptor 1 n=1 Tax=Amia ocellicauda TaxID=2972642 RepID=UPI003463A485
MGEAVANVARRINAIVEDEKDTLDLYNCKLISFPDAVYKVLRSVIDKIHVITLANNEIKVISSKFFTTFTQLRELNMKGNKLTKLPDETGTMLHLTSINLARNKFSVFPERLTDIKTLEKIDLEGNEITGLTVSPTSSTLDSENGHTSLSQGKMDNYTFSSYFQHSLPVATIFIFAYILIFFLCMVGNILVCFIVLRSKQMRTVTNIFILNLAISDLLVGIFCMPTTLVDNLITGWPFNNTMCKTSGLVQGASVSASVFTLVAIAVERFRRIVYPFRQKLTLKKATITIAVIWVLAVIIMCPSAVTLTVSKDDLHFMVDDYNNTYPLYTCWEAWPDQDMRKIYTAVLFCHIYVAPLTLIVIMYARIVIKLFKSPAPIRDSLSEDNDGRKVSKKKVRVINMLVIVALLFTVSWLPLWALMLLTDYGNLTASQLNIVTVYIFPFAHWLAFFNSSVNPIIYGYFNENFKRGFQAASKFQLCSLEMEIYDRRVSGRTQNRIFVEVKPSSTHRHKNWRKRELFGQKTSRVSHHGLVVEDLDQDSSNSVSAWNI